MLATSKLGYPPIHIGGKLDGYEGEGSFLFEHLDLSNSGSLNVEDILSKHEALEEIEMAPEQQHSHSTCISIQEAILPILE